MGLVYRRTGSSIPVAYGHARTNNFAREGDAQDSTFITYADADLANDLSTRRSVSGYCTDQPNAFHTFTGIEFIWVK